MKKVSDTDGAQRRYSFGPEVWKIAFSAFFADLGYQMVIAGLPLFLVLDLKGPAWVFGLATALAYGPGAVIGYLGGRLGDRVGRKRIAVTGNALIPLLSLTGLAAKVASAIGLFVPGWWARNFRSPARRAMLTEVVTPDQESQAFGLLHALDIGGGLLAAVGALLMVFFGLPFRLIFLLTIIPLIVSTVLVGLARAGAAPGARAVLRADSVSGAGAASAASGAGTASGAGALPGAGPAGTAGSAPGKSPNKVRRESKDDGPSDPRLYRAVLAASALFGFSFYSLGFPILTAAQSAGGTAPHAEAAGVLAYVLFLGVSAPTGLVTGALRRAGSRTLALWGYFAACAGSAVLAVFGAAAHGPLGLYAGAAVLGLALGVVETMEPTIVSRVTPGNRKSRGMGALTAARSIGLFCGNLVMGALYHLGPAWSYSYAALVAFAAAVILFSVGRRGFTRA